MKDAKIEELIVAQGKSVKQIVIGNGRVDNTHSYYQDIQFPF